MSELKEFINKMPLPGNIPDSTKPDNYWIYTRKISDDINLPLFDISTEEPINPDYVHVVDADTYNKLVHKYKIAERALDELSREKIFKERWNVQLLFITKILRELRN